MFTKNDPKTENFTKNAETVIGPSIKVNGQFHGEGDIVVEGSVEGSLKTNNFLFIGDSAKVVASIEAKEARIGGQITGNIVIKDFLEIASSANIKGDVECSQILILKGAVINGKIVMDKNKPSAAPAIK